ncbi:organic cation transporter protein-like [Portunus trituberculatus]|uniref:organic cation transporter protein-like n=1 Tax=Portunus trituberculatus TaxID=210409 RepID=UPI001E1CBF34|nr:organic cation transporter protein-like [Portunus trituberculatus]
MEPKVRPAVGYVIYISWALAMMVYGGFGFLIRDWRLLQTVVTLPGFLIIPGLWLIDESPRWLIVNGRWREALQVLTKVSRWHGVDLPPEAEMKALVEEQPEVDKIETQPFSLQRLLSAIKDEIVILFRTPRLRMITVCVFLGYTMASMVYFGLSLSGGTISDNPYVFMTLSGLMEVPAYTFTIPVVQRFGRKYTLATCFLLSALVLFALAVIPAGYSVAGVALAMMGKVCITAGFQTIIFFSSELFPTEVRSRGVSAAFMMSRIGSMVSPFITDLVGSVYRWAPFVVFGAGALLSGAVTFLLPETKGQKLPDTVAQLEEKSCQQDKLSVTQVS